MKKTLKALIFVLCFSMVLPILASCADPNQGNTGTGDYNDEYYDNSTRAKTKGNLPDDIDLEGESVGIFYWSGLELSVEGETEETDMVYTSIYERNQKVEAWLNVDLSFLPSDATVWSDVAAELTNLILTNDGSIDAAIAGSNTVVEQKLYSLFVDLNNTLYLELTQPWWNYDAIYEISVDGRVFEFLYGDILLSSITNCGAVFYNKNLYEELNPAHGPDHLYEMAKDKTWTLDHFYYLSNKTYVDRDGDQTRSNGDIYAFQIFRYAEQIHYMATAADIEYYTRNKAGFPEITINSTKSVEFSELMEKIFYQNLGADLYYPNQVGKENEHPHDFEDGRILFSLGSLGGALSETMREMEDDYGIIPYPLWDESQENYKSLIHNGAATICVPYTAVTGGYDRLEYIICPTLEAMAIEAYRSVTENFYELALKSSYTRDDIASEMIDIIVENSTKNFLYEYSGSMGGIGKIFSTVLDSQGSKKFATVYASIGDSAKTLLRDLIIEYGETFG